jgi:uncharacterized protein (TIGR03382 family)
MRLSWAGALAAAAALAAPALCRAYERSWATENKAACLFWDTRAIPFTLDASGSTDAGAAESLAAARRSFQTWGTPSCTDLVFEDKGTSSQRVIGYDSANRVLWRTRLCSTVPDVASDACASAGGCNNKYDCWDDLGLRKQNSLAGSRTIALTTVQYNIRTGEIVDADIELNGADYVFTAFDGLPCPTTTAPLPRHPSCVATDVQNTLTHEIGHIVGLDHSSVANATMFSSAPLGETAKRDLHDDDIEGLCAIYPRGKPTWTCVAQDSGGQGCSCGPGGSPMIAVLPIALAAMSRRRRPRA